MKNIKSHKALAALVVTALVTTMAVAIPSAANAKPNCTKASFKSSGKSVSYQKCTGTDWQGAK
jgi:hypothetical protein